MQAIADMYRQARRAAFIGLVVNAGLGAAKLTAGLTGHSTALIADSVNSLGDVVTSAVVMFAFFIAEKPPDHEHPYGHTRAEAVAGSNVALLVIVSALLVAFGAMRGFGGEQAPPPVWTMWLAGANVIIKEALYRYKARIGKRTESSALIANAWDHRSDALCALAVLIGLAAVRWGGESWRWADGAAALVVVAAILWSASRLFRSSVNELLDAQANQAIVQDVEAVARQTPGVRDVETLWIRKSGLEYFVDIHIEVDPAMTVADGHAVGHHVKDRIRKAFPRIRDVLVHLEPARGGEAATDDTDGADGS